MGFPSRLLIICVFVGLQSCAPIETNSLGDSSDPQQTQEILIVPPEEDVFRQPQGPLAGVVGTDYSLYSERPIIEPEAAWEDYKISVGDVVYYDGYFHMFYNGTAYPDSNREIGYALSADGYEWLRVQDEPVFEANQVSYLSTENISVESVIVDEDGTWIMYFISSPSGSYILGSHVVFIGRATASHPTGPWKAEVEPVLELGYPPAWDSAGISGLSVIKTEDGYRMYYFGYSMDAFGTAEQGIGLATSIDGISWTKYDDPDTINRAFAQSDPVLNPGEESSWDASYVLNPQVLRTQDGWVMLYLGGTRDDSTFGGSGKVGLATSDDGVEWTRYEDNPIFQPEGIFSEYYLGNLIWEYSGNIYFLFFNMGIPMNTEETYLATSGISP